MISRSNLNYKSSPTKTWHFLPTNLLRTLHNCQSI